MITAGLIAARFAHYLALMLLLGAATFRLFAAGPQTGGAGSEAPSLRRLLLWSSWAAVLAAGAVLLLTAANLSGDLAAAADPATLQVVLTETDFGRVWTFRLMVAAALAIGLTVAARSGKPAGRAGAWWVLALAGGLVVTVALTGHAGAGAGAPGAAHRIADAVHLVAAAVWLGALPPFLLLLARPLGGDAESLRTARLLQRFHRIGLLSVAALIASGLVASWFLVGDPGKLLTTLYGRVLLLKLTLFAAMLALAADNRLRLVPGLNKALAEGLAPTLYARRLRVHVRAEFILGLGVLAAVAVLGAVTPAVNA